MTYVFLMEPLADKSMEEQVGKKGGGIPPPEQVGPGEGEHSPPPLHGGAGGAWEVGGGIPLPE